MKVMFVFLLALLQSDSSTIHCLGDWGTPGCMSFKQMADKQDEDVTILLRAPNHSFVCFPPDADKFVIVSFSSPKTESFKKNSQYEYWETTGFASMSTYKNGVLDDSRPVFGTWFTFFKPNTGDMNFSTPDKAPVQASIGNSEISFRFSFTNVAGGSTTRSYTIRRSTLRFQDSYHGTIIENGKSSNFNTDETGHCAEFK